MFSRRSSASILVAFVLGLVPVALRAQVDDSWIPRNVEAISRNASFRTDFTFDRSMLALANNFIEDEDTRRIVAKLRGISVHSYKFSMPGLYDPAGLEAVRQQYHSEGWKHMVTSRSTKDPDNLGRTDVWIRFEHTNVEGAVVMLASPTNINIIAINGTLSPLDLLHLRGHFGIPRFSGDQLEEQR
ncbi:MAG TPA: hypothetical protein VHT24_06035 [Pseudacidobacterium sp.]|jgi:hypothetical protein|nr:hypothetical protein [Pseudacidobacterium sp.]